MHNVAAQVKLSFMTIQTSFRFFFKNNFMKFLEKYKFSELLSEDIYLSRLK